MSIRLKTGKMGVAIWLSNSEPGGGNYNGGHRPLNLPGVNWRDAIMTLGARGEFRHEKIASFSKLALYFLLEVVFSSQEANSANCPDSFGECARPIELGVSGINLSDLCSCGTLGSLLDIRRY